MFTPTLKFPVDNKAQSKLIQTPKFSVANKTRDFQLKFSPISKFPVSDNAQDSQTKLSPLPKLPVADKDSQPKLSPNLVVGLSYG